MSYRSPDLLRLARGQQCLLQRPMTCNRDPSTTVAAHSNQLHHGKGTGIKAHDYYTAWMCSACHAWLDQGSADKQVKHAAFGLAHGRQVQAWRRMVARNESVSVVQAALDALNPVPARHTAGELAMGAVT